MSSRSYKPLAIIGLIAAGILAFRGLTDFQSRSEEVGSKGKPLPEATRNFERTSSSSAVDRLRKLRELRASQAPNFETVEVWAQALSDAELQDLIREIGSDPPHGLTGWLRCALFAEWGRRDPVAAIAFFKNTTGRNWNSDDSMTQAAFSVLRGWACSDAEAALAQTHQPFGATSTLWDDEFLNNARVAIFRELTVRDPDQTLRLAGAGTESGLRNVPAMTGIFQGLGSKEDLVALMERWTNEVWYDSAASETVGTDQMNPDPRRALSELAIQAALSLANYDFDAAESWLREVSEGPDSFATAQSERFHVLWAIAHPDLAFARMTKGDDLDLLARYANSITFTRPDLGPELIAFLPSEEQRITFILTASSDSSLYSTNDLFAAPGRLNRLPDFQANYDAILATVAAAKLPAAREAETLKKVHFDFASRVPSAALAAGR